MAMFCKCDKDINKMYNRMIDERIDTRGKVAALNERINMLLDIVNRQGGRISKLEQAGLKENMHKCRSMHEENTVKPVVHWFCIECRRIYSEKRKPRFEECSTGKLFCSFSCLQQYYIKRECD